MKRRAFISLLGGVPFLAKLRSDKWAGSREAKSQDVGSQQAGSMDTESKDTGSKNAWSQDAGGLVSTPGKRRDYARKLLDKLCTEIGPRPTGSAAYARGARIIKNEMERSLPVVEYDRYTFERWELIEAPQFILGGQHIETWPAQGSEGTPPEGVKGILEKRESGYVLVEPRSGEELARFRVSPYGRAIPHFQRRTDPPSVPSFGLGKQDVPLLDNAVKDKSPGWLKGWVRFIPDDPGLNVIGRLPGKGAGEILFLAHADTVYTSPGANDNTASVVIMLLLAHAAAGKVFDHTITFFATDGEEYGYLGAKNYANKRIADGTINNINYVVNFDSLTYGPNLWISSEQGEVREIIRTIHRDLDIRAEPRFDHRDGFVMDSEPFRPAGAQGMHVNSRGYDEKTLPVYHRPDDYARDVPLDTVEIGFGVFDEFIRRVDKL